jgi:hypothetical protein
MFCENTSIYIIHQLISDKESYTAAKGLNEKYNRCGLPFVHRPEPDQHQIDESKVIAIRRLSLLVVNNANQSKCREQFQNKLSKLADRFFLERCHGRFKFVSLRVVFWHTMAGAFNDSKDLWSRVYEVEYLWYEEKHECFCKMTKYAYNSKCHSSKIAICVSNKKSSGIPMQKYIIRIEEQELPSPTTNLPIMP